MKRTFIKSLAALSSAVMLLGAVAQPVENFSSFGNSCILSANAATYSTGAYGTKYCYSDTNGVYLYYKYVNITEGGITKKAIEITGSCFTKEASITIPETIDSYPVVGINTGAFEGQKNLTQFFGGKNIKYIKDNAFKNCNQLTYIPQLRNINTIGDYAFYGCKMLSCSINFDNKCTSIGRYAFANCDFYSIDLSQTGIKTIPERAFYNNKSAVKIKLPLSVESIECMAFAYCKGIQHISIPDSVTSIGVSAFNSCSGLTTVIIPEATAEIGASAFLSCPYLNNFACKNPDVTIGNYAIGYNSGRGGALKRTDGLLTVFGNGGNVELYAKNKGFNYKSISKTVSDNQDNMKDYKLGIINRVDNFAIGSTAIIISEHEGYINGLDKTIKGDCFGISMLSALARNGYIKVEDITKDTNLSTLDILKTNLTYPNGKTEEDKHYEQAVKNVKSFINVLHINQNAVYEYAYDIKPEINNGLLTADFLNDIECITYGEDVCVLSYIYHNPYYAHSVVCYGLENGDYVDNTLNKKWNARIMIDDPNTFDMNDYIYVNTEDGSWKIDANAYCYVDNNGNVQSKGNGVLRLHNSNNLYNDLKQGAIDMLKDYGCTHPSLK